MEPDRITQIDRELNQVIAEISTNGFRSSVDDDAIARLTQLSDERVRLTEPVLNDSY